jgi:hypothetical protein
MMLPPTVEKGYIQHPDPDILVALYRGFHDYDDIGEAEAAVDDGEISELELEAIEEGFIEREKT